MIRKYSLLLLLLFMISVFSFAQKVKVTGIVFNKQNETLENVVVSQKGTSNGVYTNEKGIFQLEIAPAKTVELEFSFIGYKKGVFTLSNLKKDELLSITLEDADGSLAPVIIEGRRITSSGMEHIDYLATNQRANPWNSIESLLMTMAGVSSHNELSSQYSVRGGNFDENTVYVNGIEIYRPLLVRSAQQEGLSFINPRMVQNINFSAGGFNAEYGDKMSSVLDVTYKRPEQFEGAASVGLLGGEVYVGNSTERFSQISSVRYKTMRSLLNTTDTKAEYDPSFIDVQTYMTYNWKSGWEVDFLGNYAHNKYQFTPKTRETKFGSLTSPKAFLVHFNGWEDDLFVTYQAALTLKGKIGENINIGFSSSTFSSDEQERYDIEGRYLLSDANIVEENNNSALGIGGYHEHARNKLESEVYTLSHFGSLQLDAHKLKWGVSYQTENIKDKIKEWEMRDSAGYSIPNTGTDVNLYWNLKSDNHIKPNRVSGYIQDTYRLETGKGLFIINAGVRANYWSFNDEVIISPRGSVAFIPEGAEYLSFRIAGGIYYQAPFYKEFQRIVNADGNNVIELNKDIKSQKSVHIVLGSDYYFGSGVKRGTPPFKLSGEIYYKKLTDLIPYTVDNVKIRYSGENSSDGYSMGADFKLYGEFIPGVDSWVSLSFMKSEQTINEVKVPLPTDQRFNLALFYQDYFPGYERLRMSLKGLWSQGLPVSRPREGYDKGYFRTPSYKRVDIGFSWQLLGEDFSIRNKNSFCNAFKNIYLGADIFNVFDMKNTSTYYWISDVNNKQHAVPNYLTGRQINFRIVAEF